MLSIAACTSCSVNSGMLPLSFLIFIFFLIRLFVRIFPCFQLCVVHRAHLVFNPFLLVLFLLCVEFAVEFREHLCNKISGCDDFVFEVTCF